VRGWWWSWLWVINTKKGKALSTASPKSFPNPTRLILVHPSMSPKDEESPADYNFGGYLQVNLNDSFKDGRYTVLRKLGYVPFPFFFPFRPAPICLFSWGHFSTVWLVKDSLYVSSYISLPPLFSNLYRENRHSALKIVKSAGRYSETARDEIKLLRQIASTSPSHPGRAHIVDFLDSFTHTISSVAHICITFEPLGENLLSLIEKNRKKGVPPCVVKSIAKQVLLGLQYLHEKCDLVHTDIKPENISQFTCYSLWRPRLNHS
jgi:serine/threonine-protein kinase SRPK3